MMNVRLLLFFVLLVSADCFAQSIHPLKPVTEAELELRREKIRQDNEFRRNEKGKHTNIHVDCLMLNGRPMDIAYFSTKSWGILTVVKGKPGTAEASPLPFRVYLRRDGALVYNPLYQNPVYHISLSLVLSMARPGDQLIVDPVREEDYKAKRILQLID